jgi:hypothetical protein
MADAPKKDDAKSLPDRLVSDPKSPPELSLLQGWLGASSEDRHRRLYLDPELSQSLEIPEDAIVSTQDMPRESNPLGGSWVWVKADAAIKQGPGIERLYARFLRGQIHQDFFAAGGGGLVGAGNPALGAAAAIPPTSPIVCQLPPTIVGCPTRQVWCRPSIFTVCPTQTFICQTRFTCPSQFTICPTQPPACQVTAGFTCNTRICPSVVDGCPSTPGGCFDPWVNPAIDPAVNVFAQGPAFDPGAGFGLTGAPAAAAANPFVAQIPPTRQVWCRPSIFTICPTQTFICQTRFTCPSQFTICPTQPPACQVTAGFTCNTRICPSAVDACPSAPGGCFDPGLNPAINPAVNIGQGLAFDQGAAFGMVGAPPPPPTSPVICQFQPTIVGCPTRQVWCQPSVFTVCPTLTPQCQSRFVACQSQFTLCRTQFNCPTLSPACLVTAGFTCNTRICPSAVDACPSAPGGCFDPGGPVFDPGGGFGGGGFAGGLVGAQVTMVWPPCTPSAFGPCQTRFGCGGGPWT